MCGIFGVAGRESPAGFRSAAQTLTHRGPDGFGDWWSPEHGVYLAHCRLAIIDLSEAGRQPMENEDGSVRITFNGEIYNYRELRQQLLAAGHVFRSQTDTEVIIHAWEEWGEKCVERLRGIFAFAIWNERSRQITIVRDRLGVKPLYYRLQGSELIFASEPRAILAIPNVPRSINIASALHFLRYSYTSGNDCVWNGIQRLPPGALLTYRHDSAAINISKYWALPTHTQPANWASAVDEAEALISDATKEQLVSDVPVGVFLSGGIDSSLVSTYAGKFSPSINSFCVDFSGWEHSESEDAKIVAAAVGTSHHTCIVDQAKCRFADPDIANQFFMTWDEPLGDAAIIPTWHISRMIRKFVTVALSGDGGDEIFSGYRWYSGVQGTPRRRAAWFAESIRRSMGIGRLWPHGCADEFEYFHLLHCPSFSTAELSNLFPDWHQEIGQLRGEEVTQRLISSDDGPIRRWQRVDAESYLVDNNLARVDRASMAHGLEVRVPLLDHRLVEFAFRLPDEFGLRGGVQKPILRELASRHLPERIRSKPKQGFSFPVGDFISLDSMANVVENGTLAASGILDGNALRTWKSDVTQVSSLKLWLLYTFEQWAKHWLFRAWPLPNDLMTAGIEGVR
jgi:asparagine synthase (glutamine-hydrolysing)